MATLQQVAAQLARLLESAGPNITTDAASVTIKRRGKVRKINVEPVQGSDRGVQSR
jgi:hypothetical protein